MTNAELKKALLNEDKIEYTYMNENFVAEKITAIIYRKGQNNKIYVQVELSDKSNSVLIVKGDMCSRIES